MLDAVLRRLSKDDGGGRRGDEMAVAVTDDNGRTLGVEDPHDPALVDDAAVTEPSLTLIEGRGLPYIDPARYGGSSLNQTSPGLGEPLNVIISALSTPELLTRKGLQGYLRSLDYDMECFGLHSGNAQRAFLDPRGWQDEVFLYRQVYTPFDHVFGTCIESLRGGNHLRAFQQQGTAAWFLAVSHEENLSKHHMIIPNGYNIGRDELVDASQKRKDATTSFMFKTYRTSVRWVDGLMQPGTQGVNHAIAVDGRVAVLTITLVRSDEKARLKAVRKAQQSTATAMQPIVSGAPAAAPVSSPTNATKRRSLLKFKPLRKQASTSVAI